MKYNKVITLAIMLPAGVSVAATSQAYDVVPAGEPVVTGEPSRVGAPWNHRSTFNIPGTNTDVAFGGYIKLDAFYDFDFDQGDSTDPLALLNPANRTDGRTNFTAKESRLNFRTQTRTDHGTVSTYLEGHFLPDGKFNLRHAYGEFGGFLAGQSWTNFMHFLGTPRSLKLGGPIGYATGRPSQVRYTHRSGPNTFAVSLEEPSFALSPIGSAGVDTENRLPTLTARYQFSQTFGISALVSEFSTNEATSGVDERTIGYGVAAQLALPLGSATTFKANATVGSGLGSYLSYVPDPVAGGRTPDAYVDADGSLKSVDAQAYGISLEHRWSADWSSAIGASRFSQDLPEEIAGFQAGLDRVQYSYANLIWDINDRLATGIEYQHSDIERVNGESDDAHRIQASVQFQF
ncbi:DcaP family trimeric outer membrane transporter [Halomonas sp. M4R5S39]|uniref:DcaP family trimeric outer membrane transporter n=1 Tax=Halomonas kalidii TaxID=3043293 RepID=UPI0024A8B67C|nr:DcaP family trimeric outer membrane transporter [Halomonas kalidii]MDI5987510.1 DcaP family trimeric outer membrane transporter [Halomonas kalidii]